MVIASNRSLQHLYAFTMLLFSVHFNTGVGDVGIQCIERERQALLRIKHDLIDDYDVLSSWTTAEDRRDCCIWRGIACDNRTSHVTELYLHFNETADKPLRGKINHSLLELRHLTYLDLRGNDFGGTQFPADKNGSLSKLRYLDLSNANFAGTISSVLANLSSLQSLCLNLNHFHDLGNVEWLHGLSSLSYLHLSGNPLVRPSDWLQIANKLTLLKSLRLALCFSGDGIPPTLSPLNSSSSLTFINLSDNNLVIPSIHPWLSNISQNIIQLDLSHNLLQSSTPAEIGHMVSLEILNLSNTSLVGSVPKSLGNMSHLRSLHLSRNNLKMQLPDLIQNLSGSTEKSLEELYLHGNEITGPLPNFTNFSSLRIIDLHNNSLKETIDKSIGLLSKLQILHLGLNSLHGVISEDHFLNLSNLKFLSLSGNSLVLNLSLDWVPPFSLHYIHLQSCKMGPHFPKWLQTQKYYCELDISDAEISDSIPMWFWNLSSASNRLNISHNNLSGMVPHVSLHLYYFPTIDMSFNRLEGPLPLLLLPSKLESITRSMSFEDQRTIRTLIYLDLSNNLFSGVIPDHLMHMQDLIFLNLANNNLSGKVPTSIGWLSNLETLNLGNNALSGELPLSLKNCSGLRFIDLSGNKLSGNIPTWIGEHLISLQYLSLQSNQFHGNIPLQLCQLTHVQILDLSVNNINGTLPHCIKNLRAMADRNSTETIKHEFTSAVVEDGFLIYHYIDKGLVLWKVRNYGCDKNLGRFRIINLSRNKIGGEIPREISSLSQLNQLNLSNNKLAGAIPEEIGCLKQLESLDLSQNQLSGRLPASLAELNFLNTLNLSNNNLSGRIPSSTQLQSFNESAFSDNLALCGSPLPQKCPGDNIQVSQQNHNGQYNQEDGEEFWKLFYVGMGIGFIVGFWGVSGTLLLKFKLLDKMQDWVYVRTTVYMRSLQQKFHS